jgi:hypothetical protein
VAALLATTVPDTADLGDTEPLAGLALTGVLPMTLGMPATRPTAPARWRGSRHGVKRAAAALAVPAAVALAWFATGIGPADPPLPREAMPPPAAQAAFAAPSQEASAATAAPVATPVSAGLPNPGSATPAPHAKPDPKQKAKPSPKHSSGESNDRK